MSTNIYTWNYVIYISEQELMVSLGHAQTVAMNLSGGRGECYRIVVVDNFITSTSRLKSSLEHDRHLIGILRRNHIGA